MTFLYLLTISTTVLLALFCLFAIGSPLSLPLTSPNKLTAPFLGAGLLWLADMLEHNPKASRHWGRTLVYVSQVRFSACSSSRADSADGVDRDGSLRVAVRGRFLSSPVGPAFASSSFGLSGKCTFLSAPPS